MQVTKIYHKHEIETCASMYFPMNDWIMADYNTYVSNLFHRWKTNKFLRVAREGDTIVAWLLGSIVSLSHNNYFNYQQDYFCSNGTMMQNARAVKLLHNALIDDAEALSIPSYSLQALHLMKVTPSQDYWNVMVGWHPE